MSAVVAVAVGAVLSTPPPAPAADGAIASPNMKHVANLRWRAGDSVKPLPQFGTDVEFATINGRDYALAGSYGYGLHVIDITDPTRPREVGLFPCNIAQGDVQVFRQGNRTLASYTSDNGYGPGGSACTRGLANVPQGRWGTYLVDLSEPTRPKAVSYLPINRGSHNMTVHPSGQWLYNSDADLPGKGQVEVWDIRKPDKPKWFTTLDLGHEAQASAHDISFSPDGKRAYVAGLVESFILDTGYPGTPSVIARIVDPAVNIHHQAEPVTLAGPGGIEHTFLVITDELTGGSQNVACPGGGLHVYDITGALENAPVKVGVFQIPEVRTGPYNGRCTSHVLRMHPREGIMTIAWYAAGSRVIDLKGLTSMVGVSAGVKPADGSLGTGMRELGFFEFSNSETWSAKTNRIAPDGSFYLYANDQTRGFDVFKYVPPAPSLTGSGDGIKPGRWLTPDQALAEAGARSAGATVDYRPVCLLLGV